jgi:hypothetical protein
MSEPPSLEHFAALMAKLLGLPEGTPPEELLAKLGAAMKTKAAPDPAQYMPVSAVQEMLADRLQERRTADRGRAQEKVRAAIQQRYITPGMRDWALALCESDEASFDAFLGKVGPVFAHLGKSPSAPAAVPDRPTTLASDLETSICEQLGLKPGKLQQ